MSDHKHQADPEHRPLSDRDPSTDPTRCGYHGGRRGDGKPCVGPVIAGTKRCRMHAGVPREVARARGEITLEVRKWMLDGHDGADVSPGETLLKLIAFWSFKVNEVGRMLGEAVEAAERLRQAHAAEQLLVSSESGDVDGELESPAVQAARHDLERIFSSGGVAALVGYRFDADRHGRVYAAEEAIRGLAKLDGEYSDRLARYCAMAITARIAETQVEIAKAQGAAVFGLTARVNAILLEQLGMSDEQRALAVQLLPRVLTEELEAATVRPLRVIDGAAAPRAVGGAWR